MARVAKNVSVWTAAGLVLLLTLGSTAGARQSSDEKHILVTVMNLRTGNPIPGVTAANLGIKEDGKDREIVTVEPASGPVSVVLLADTTDTLKIYINELRATTKGFVTAMMAKVPGSTISLWQFGGAGVPVTPFLTDPAALNEEAGKLRPRDVVSGVSAAGSNLLEGVVDGAKALGKRTEARRAIVSFNTLTASEGSKVQKSQVVGELQKNGASWYGVSFADGGTGSPNRDSLMSEVMPMSGGMRLMVQDVSRLEGAVKALADIIGSQYLVTYRRSGSAKEVAVEVKAEGARAFHARWAPR
jgi:hypothetical protein